MTADARNNLQCKAVNEVKELVKNFIIQESKAKLSLNSPFVKKYGLFFEIDYGDVYGIVIRGQYSTKNEIVRNRMAHEVMSEVWQWIPDFGNKHGFSVKKPGNLSYVFYDRGGNFW